MLFRFVLHRDHAVTPCKHHVLHAQTGSWAACAWFIAARGLCRAVLERAPKPSGRRSLAGSVARTQRLACQGLAQRWPGQFFAQGGIGCRQAQQVGRGVAPLAHHAQAADALAGEIGNGGVLKSDRRSKKIKILDIENCSMCKSCVRASANGYINVGYHENDFIFRIETDGSMSPKEVLLKACEELGNKTDKFIRFSEEGGSK